MIRFLTVLVCIGFAYARFALPFESVTHPEDFFKDSAHLWVGDLYGAAALGYCFTVYVRRRRDKYAGRGTWIGTYSELDSIKDFFGRCSRLMLVLAVALTVLEVVAFFYHKR